MSRLVLHRALASPPARSVMILGDMLGLQFDYRDVKLLQLEHRSEEYRKMNPMSTVPVLEDGDFILSERLVKSSKIYKKAKDQIMVNVKGNFHAILKYLTKTYGGERRARLYPRAAQAQARVDQGLFFNSGFFFPKMAAVAMPALFEGAGAPTRRQLADIGQAYAALEALLRARRFVAADHCTLADLSVGTTAAATALIEDIDRDRYPRITDWMSELNEIPCFKNINAEGIYALKMILSKVKEMNKSKAHTSK